MFTPTELIDVQAAADILTQDSMPIVRMTRSAAWLALCETLAEWMVEFERTRARLCASYGKDVLETTQTPIQREVAWHLLTNEMGERSVGSCSL